MIFLIFFEKNVFFSSKREIVSILAENSINFLKMLELKCLFAEKARPSRGSHTQADPPVIEST